MFATRKNLKFAAAPIHSDRMFRFHVGTVTAPVGLHHLTRLKYLIQPDFK